MRSILYLVMVINMCSLSSAVGQSQSSQDSIEIFYEELLDNLESKYIYRKDVVWKDIREWTLEKVEKASSLEEAMMEVSPLFDSIKCNHCYLFAPNDYYASSLNKPLKADDFSEAFKEELESKPSFEVKLLDGEIGYINIPGMLMIDLPQDSLNIETQKMYDQVAALIIDVELKAWIVDLRFNTGGNVYPMLAALQPLLGDNIVYKAMGVDGNITMEHRLRDGGFYSGDTLELKIDMPVEANLEIPVALFSRKMTGSSGEDILVAFKDRRNTIVIGEESYGLLTGNDLFELPYDTQVALTTSFIVDANGVYEASIIPDLTVVKQDNFKDLLQDGLVIKAVEFFNSFGQ